MVPLAEEEGLPTAVGKIRELVCGWANHQRLQLPGASWQRNKRMVLMKKQQKPLPHSFYFLIMFSTPRSYRYFT